MDNECESVLLWKNQHADMADRKGCQGVKRTEMKPAKHSLINEEWREGQMEI
jgi:hypothetical protein